MASPRSLAAITDCPPTNPRAAASWREAISARRDSAAWRLCDLLLRRPVVNARLVADELAIPVGNVHRYVQPLLAAGIMAGTRDVTRN